MIMIACFHFGSVFFKVSEVLLLTGVACAAMSSADNPRSLVTPYFRLCASSLVSHMMKSMASLGCATVDGTARALPPPNVTGCEFAFMDGGGATRQSVLGSLVWRPSVKLVLVSIAAHLREIISCSWLSPVISSVLTHCFCAHSPRNL